MIRYAVSTMVPVLTMLLWPEPGRAQEDPPSRAARLGYIDGAVSFQPAGEVDWATAQLNRPLTIGDRLWSDENSRVEIALGTAVVRLGENTAFAFLDLDDAVAQLQLTQGSLQLRVRSMELGEIIEIDTPQVALSIQQPGSYRLDVSADGQHTGVSVDTGEAELQSGDQRLVLTTGEHADATGVEQIQITTTMRPAYDDFDRFCQQRDQRFDTLQSPRHVAATVVGCEDLDDHGSWEHDEVWGHLWFPTVIVVGWAPYRFGHWQWIPPWGWTWVDDAPWGFAPFHYGRWVYIHGRWAWRPGPTHRRAVFAPAFVVFAHHGPHRRNVAWFPLGPGEAYTPGHHASHDYWERINDSSTTFERLAERQRFEPTASLPKGNYRFGRMPQAVSVVTDTAFAQRTAIGYRALTANDALDDGSPYGAYAPVAPLRRDLFGSDPISTAHRPPTGVESRTVLARRTPPALAVPFAAQAPALKAHPGRPLARPQVDSLRLTQPRKNAPVRPLTSSPRTLVTPAPLRADRPPAIQPTQPHSPTTPSSRPTTHTEPQAIERRELPPPRSPERGTAKPHDNTPTRPSAPTRPEPTPTPRPRVDAKPHTSAPAPAPEPAPPSKKKAKNKDKRPLGF